MGQGTLTEVRGQVGGHSLRFGTGRGTLGESGTGRGTPWEVMDGSGTLGEVRDGSGDTP